MQLNVFICTYNPRPIYLDRTIQSILSQDLDKSLWDLTIIDNNSKEPVADLDFVKRHNVNTVVEKKQGLTAARLCATDKATAEVLVFVDDDMVLDPDYLSIVLEEFSKNKYLGIMSGNISPEYEIEPGSWFYKHEEMIAIRRFEGTGLLCPETSKFSGYFPIGAGMALRRKLIAEYYHQHLNEGNYIEGRKGADLSSAEDIDLDFYALSKNYQIGINPRLHSLHLIPSKRTEFAYIKRLTVSALKSSREVNKKWAAHFKHNVCPPFDISLPKLFAGNLIYLPLGLFNRAYFVRFLIYRELLKYKLFLK